MCIVRGVKYGKAFIAVIMGDKWKRKSIEYDLDYFLRSLMNDDVGDARFIIQIKLS